MATEKAAPAHHTTVRESSESSKTPLVAKQPQSKQKAALNAHIYLHTDSDWADAYFDENDLHFMDRELFG
jgi:hypothetical protein